MLAMLLSCSCSSVPMLFVSYEFCNCNTEMLHHGIREYCQSTSKVQAWILQNIRVYCALSWESLSAAHGAII